MTSSHPALLPNGLMDLLPPDAEREPAAIETLISRFAAFGYRRVKPPLVEFEDCLLAPGPGHALARSTFRLMDPVSQRMMGVRADTTAQIARIASSRMKGEGRPLRLSYAVDVLRVNGTQLRPDRQFCQTGCELIGASGTDSDVEIALVALAALGACGTGAVTIDLNAPALIPLLFDSFGLEEEERAPFLDLIARRDRDGLERKGGDVGKALVALLDAAGEGKSASCALRALPLPLQARNEANLLCDAHDGLQSALGIYGLGDVSITLDPAEHRGLSYHSGVSFTLFSPHARGELGSGGRYALNTGENAEMATGFTLYMDSVLGVLPLREDARTKTVPAGTDWKTIKALQDEGWSVSKG